MRTEEEIASVSGLFVNRRTCEKQMWLDGRLIGACSLTLPQQAQNAWLLDFVFKLDAEAMVKIANGTLGGDPSGVIP